MSSRALVGVFFAGGIVAAAFVVGRATAPAAQLNTARSAQQECVVPAAGAVFGAAGRPEQETKAAGTSNGGAMARYTTERSGDHGSGSATATVQSAATVAQTCTQELIDCRGQSETALQQRRQQDGAPIAMPAELPERFSQATLTTAFTQAVRQSKVPARLETVDCAEFPCIVYGRIFGDEEWMERIERAKALNPYDADVMTTLLWTSTAAEQLRGSTGSRERTLFAVALYSREQLAKQGTNLDKRIRTRTVDLWNILHPDDEQ